MRVLNPPLAAEASSRIDAKHIADIGDNQRDWLVLYQSGANPHKLLRQTTAKHRFRKARVLKIEDKLFDSKSDTGGMPSIPNAMNSSARTLACGQLSFALS